MGKIQVLDEVLANQIAAGEVVERPASAAKELLENALDAGATAITVELVGGGVERLRVVDDGSGMSAEDAVLALSRHATSKLRTAADLHHIATLGFRGEALPSIASVSRFKLKTREREALGAVLLTLEGGKNLQQTEVAGPVGTEIVVEDLFFNVPARRKFLKQASTEASHVLETLQQLALCYPKVAFRLIKDGKVTLDLPRHEDLSARAFALFGGELSDALKPVSLSGPISIHGLAGGPASARSTARHYHLFVNGRFVRDRVIIAAVQTAYRPLIDGKHPFVVLSLTLPPEAVDVNVHPAKTEVRFVDTSAIHRAVVRALDEALKEAVEAPAPPAERAYTLGGPLPDLGAPTTGLDAHRQRVFDAMEKLADRRGQLGGAGRVVPKPAHIRAPLPLFQPSEPTAPTWSSGAPVPEAPPAWLTESPVIESPVIESPVVESPVVESLVVESPVVEPSVVEPPVVEVDALWVGALAIVPQGGALWVVAPRVLWEDKLFKALSAGAPSVPVSPARSFTVPATAISRLERLTPALLAVGLVLEPFGGRSFALAAAPSGISAAVIEGWLNELLTRPPALETPTALRRSLAHQVAKAGEPPPLGTLLDGVTPPCAGLLSLNEAALSDLLEIPRG